MSGLVRATLVSLALAILLWTVPVQAQTSARMGKIADFYRSRDGFMGIVAVARKGRIVFEKCYGNANVERKTPFAQDTRFPIGSLSKQFTAAAILLLQQDGKLKTSDPIARFYNQAPAAWAPVTLRHLLTHTSGIPDFDFSLSTRPGSHSPQGSIQAVIEKPLQFEPGTAFDYTNANYVLLGMVIENASEEPYCQFLRERIFAPLKLTETGCDWQAGRIAHSASGYRPNGKNFEPAEDDDLTGIAGAGSVYSTAEDLIRWTSALHGGKLLSQASLKEMTTPFLGGYGYGLEIQDGVRIGHNGAIDGFYAGLDYLPAKKSTVLVLSNVNTNGNQTSPGAFAIETEVMELLLDKHAILPSEGRELPLPAEALRRYVGHYTPAAPRGPTSFTISLRGDHLFIQLDGPGNSAALLRAESQTEFYVADNVAELEVDFGPNASATVIDYNGHSSTEFIRASDAR